MTRTRWNPPDRYTQQHLERDEPEALAPLEVRSESARSALSENDSPDLPFRWSLNPYRGCQHACAYCYARPTHPYLGLGAGSDFERKLVVKQDLAAVLARELAGPGWRGEPISIAGVTDPYQPLEAEHGITRSCLEVCLRFQNPVTIVTKGVLVLRDADLLAELARTAGARVFVSIPLFDAQRARAVEPAVASPRERLAVLEELSRRGVPTGLALAPFIPRLSEVDLAHVIEGAAKAGATAAFLVLLRLPAEVLEIFRRRLEEVLPGEAESVLAALAEMRAGRLQEARFGVRMAGSGPRFAAVEQLFHLLCRRYGLRAGEGAALQPSRPRPRPGQGLLF